MKWRAMECALVGLLLALVVGCRKAGPRHPEVSYGSAVSQVELVESDTDDVTLRLEEADRDRCGVRMTLRRPGPLDGLDPPVCKALVARGRDHLAIIDADFTGPDQGGDIGGPLGQPSRRNGMRALAQRRALNQARRTDRSDVDGRLLWSLGWRPREGGAIWLAGTDGQPIGQIDLRWLEPEGGVLGKAAVWDGAGRRLAAWVSFGRRIHVGLVDLEFLVFSPVALVDDVGLWPVAVGKPTLLWRGDELIFCYEAENSQGEAENVVLCIDPATGQVREVLREVRWDPSRRPMHAVSLSSDGRHLVFDRAWSARLLTAGGKCGGIWALDLESGECVELTYEYASTYQHQVVHWEDADTLLFARRVEVPSRAGVEIRYDLYRAHLDLPTAEDPSSVQVVARGEDHSLTQTKGAQPLARPVHTGSDSPRRATGSAGSRFRRSR